MQNRGRRTGRRTVAAMAAAGLIMAMSVGLLTGCSDTKIVVTTGLASNELFRIGSETCKLSEALVYLCNEKSQYENVYGIEMWDHNVGDMTLEEYLKNQVVSQLSQVKSMVLLADEREIALTDSEKQKAAEAAKEYFTSLSEEEVSALKVSQEGIQTMYEDYCLADKAYEQITGDEAVEISDDKHGSFRSSRSSCRRKTRLRNLRTSWTMEKTSRAWRPIIPRHLRQPSPLPEAIRIRPTKR